MECIFWETTVDSFSEQIFFYFLGFITFNSTNLSARSDNINCQWWFYLPMLLWTQTEKGKGLLTTEGRMVNLNFRILFSHKQKEMLVEWFLLTSTSDCKMQLRVVLRSAAQIYGFIRRCLAASSSS